MKPLPIALGATAAAALVSALLPPMAPRGPDVFELGATFQQSEAPAWRVRFERPPQPPAPPPVEPQAAHLPPPPPPPPPPPRLMGVSLGREAVAAFDVAGRLEFAETGANVQGWRVRRIDADVVVLERGPQRRQVTVFGRGTP